MHWTHRHGGFSKELLDSSELANQWVMKERRLRKVVTAKDIGSRLEGQYMSFIQRTITYYGALEIACNLEEFWIVSIIQITSRHLHDS